MAIVGKRRGPQGFWWFIHNMFGHPLSEIFHLMGLEKASEWIHDETLPRHDTNEEGRG